MGRHLPNLWLHIRVDVVGHELVDVAHELCGYERSPLAAPFIPNCLTLLNLGHVQMTMFHQDGRPLAALLSNCRLNGRTTKRRRRRRPRSLSSFFLSSLHGSRRRGGSGARSRNRPPRRERPVGRRVPVGRGGGRGHAIGRTARRRRWRRRRWRRRRGRPCNKSREKQREGAGIKLAAF